VTERNHDYHRIVEKIAKDSNKKWIYLPKLKTLRNKLHNGRSETQKVESKSVVNNEKKVKLFFLHVFS
jgi:hypothetical protein